MKCQSCAVRLTSLCSMVSEPAAAELSRSVHRRRIPAGQVVYGGAQKNRTYAIVLSGVVKLVHSKPDGRSQIVGLQFSGDFIGRPLVEGGNLLAEASTDLELCSFSDGVFRTLSQTYPEFERAILTRTVEDLDAARDWMFMLGRQTAQERVASLLLLFARRLGGPSNGEERLPGPLRFNIPLSRTDIASCLGVRLETVSRQFAALKADGVIATGRTRDFEILDLDELRRRAETSPD